VVDIIDFDVIIMNSLSSAFGLIGITFNFMDFII